MPSTTTPSPTSCDSGEIDRFDYGDLNGPYVVSQLTGAYQWIPDFLDSQHTIETKADAEAYLSRLEASPAALDQETSWSATSGLGVIPPDFAIDKIGCQMRACATRRRQVAAGAVGRPPGQEGERRITRGKRPSILTARVDPALDRQIALMAELQPARRHDAGVWRLPDGEAYYAPALRSSTTTDMTPDEIHNRPRTGAPAVGRRSTRS